MNRLDTPKKLARKRASGGLAFLTETYGSVMHPGSSLYSNRELPGMQEHLQGGTSHATPTVPD